MARTLRVAEAEGRAGAAGAAGKERVAERAPITEDDQNALPASEGALRVAAKGSNELANTDKLRVLVYARAD